MSQASRPIRVMIVDDHLMVRRGLVTFIQAIPDLELAGDASGGEEALCLCDQATPDVGVANAKNIVSDPAILCVVGHYNSGVQIPSSEEYHAANLANVSPANTNPKVTDRGYLEVNRIVGRDDVQGVVAAQFANSKGMKSAYILHDKTAYGQGIAEFFKFFLQIGIIF